MTSRQDIRRVLFDAVVDYGVECYERGRDMEDPPPSMDRANAYMARIVDAVEELEEHHRKEEALAMLTHPRTAA